MTEIKKVKGTLLDRDGNAFALIGHFRRLAKRQGWTLDEISAVTGDAMSGDYDHLLGVLMSRMTMDDD